MRGEINLDKKQFCSEQNLKILPNFFLPHISDGPLSHVLTSLNESIEEKSTNNDD